MYWIAEKYLHTLSKKLKHKYVVVKGHRVLGSYSWLRKAVRRLRRIGRRSTESRCIFMAVNGRVLKRPYHGGNYYFRTKGDAKYIYLAAYKYVHYHK